jgi:hypothetical protein
VEAISPELTTPTKDMVDPAGKPHREALHATRQRELVSSLHEEMKVMVLKRIMHDAQHSSGVRCANRAHQCSQNELTTESPKSGAQRDMHGQTRAMLRPSHMTDPFS